MFLNDFERIAKLFTYEIISFIFCIEILTLYKVSTYNLNLPETQTHNYHLFDEQQIYYKKFQYSHRFSNGYSVLIPVCLSVSILLLCFFFVNYLWGDTLYSEVCKKSHSSCGGQDHLFGSRNFVLYLIVTI